MTFLLLVVAAFFIAGTVLLVFSHDHWVVRLFDFPRVQLAVGIVLTLGSFVAAGPASPKEYGTMAVLGVCLISGRPHPIVHCPGAHTGAVGGRRRAGHRRGLVPDRQRGN